MKVKCKLIIGLGNPGREYAKTYHNVGFLAVDYLGQNPLVSKMLKSDVFMNDSGNFVKKALKKYKVRPEESMIIHDDSDIELGKYKVSFARNSAGHHGIDSIIKSLGTNDFWRLRIGIGKKAKVKAKKLVLKKISKADWEILLKVFEEISYSLCQK